MHLLSSTVLSLVVIPLHVACQHAEKAMPDTAVGAAVDAMVATFYNQTDGMFSSSDAWWLSGNALTAVVDYMLASNSTKYMSQVLNTIALQRGVLPWWPSGGGSFRTDSTDDTAWWALAMVRMFDLTRDTQYLDLAKLDEAYLYSYWDVPRCGGGIIWNIPQRSYKNAISNELYIKLAASLHNRIPGDTMYLGRARTTWQWFESCGMINSANLINDGLGEQPTGGNTTVCSNNGYPIWSYNQGVVLGALTELFHATGDGTYLRAATSFANAVVNSTNGLTVDGILTESCEKSGDPCNADQNAFKGIFVRNLAELDAQLPDRPYRQYLAANAASMLAHDKISGGDLYGLRWAGPVGTMSIGSQTSAVDLLIASMRASRW
jgi:predicted alpha-1,6-mannanase (GH76 family)